MQEDKSQNYNQISPKEGDAVIDGQNKPPQGTAILGGINGTMNLVKMNSSPEAQMRGANYGENGFRELCKIVISDFYNLEVKKLALILIKSPKMKLHAQSLMPELLQVDLNFVNSQKISKANESRIKTHVYKARNCQNKRY